MNNKSFRPPFQTTCRALVRAMIVTIVFLPLCPVVNAASYTWDPDLDAVNGAGGGSGTWDTTSLEWRSPTAPSNGVWPNDTTADPVLTAVFAGTAGTVTLTGTTVLNVNSITFATTGYTLTGGTLNVGGTGVATFAVGALSQTINSSISGTNAVSFTGGGTLSLGGSNTFSGGLTSAGTLNLNNNNAAGTGSITYASGSVRIGNGITIGNNVGFGATTNDLGMDVPTGTGTFGGSASITGGGQFRPGTSSVSATLFLTGSSALGTSNFIVPRGNVVVSGSAFISASAGLAIGRSTSATVTTFTVRDNAVVALGAFSMGGNLATPGTIAITIQDNGSLSSLGTSGVGAFDIHNSSTATTTTTLNLNGGTLTTGTIIKTRTGVSQTSVINFNGGVLRSSTSTTTFLQALTGLTARVLGGGAKVDTNGFNITIAQPLISGTTSDGGLFKLGQGILTLSGNETYNGPTTVQTGTLALSTTGTNNIATSSKIIVGNSVPNSAAVLDVTGVTGGFQVVNSQTLAGHGTVTGTATINSAGRVAPGNTGVGTLTIGSVTLSTGSILDFEFNTSTPANDLLAVSNLNGLIINGGAFNFNLEGSANKLTTTGTYNLIQYTGAIGGSGTSALTVANQVAGLTYVFGTSGNFVTVTITGTAAANSVWNVDSDGSWGLATNWLPNVVPNSPGATASFLGVITAPRTVTLDGDRTVGDIELSNTNSYTIASGSGGSLFLDSGTPSAAVINDNLGSHTISAPIILSSSSAVITVVNAIDTLTLSGAVSGTTANLAKNGPGTLILSGSNNYANGTALNGGVTQVTNNSALSTGTVSMAGNSTVRAGADGLNLANSFALNAGTSTIDTQGNTLTLSGTISGGAGLGKSGTGTLILLANNTFGATTITSGTLQVGNGGTSGSLGTGAVGNAAALIFNRSDTLNQPGAISGAGTLTQAGSGTLVLDVANTLSGSTLISSGTVQLGNTLSLQSSTVTATGDLTFGALASATLGGLAGSRNIVLTNNAAGAVALTVGNNNSSTTYSGGLSGLGSLTKAGTGVFTLTGSSSYAGTTAITTGTLEVGSGGVINGGAFTGAANATARLLVSGGSFTASGTSTLNGVSSSGGGANFLMTSGSATFGTLTTASSDGALIRVNGGRFTADTVTLVRTTSTAPASTGTTTGFYITGGTANITTVAVATGASTATVRVDGGTLNTSTVTLANQQTATRGGVIEVNGGNFIVSDTTSGLVMVKNNATAVNQVANVFLNGGVTTLGRLTFGFDSAVVAGSFATVTVANNATLYIGGGGIVKNATDANLTSAINLTNTSILGASADWSTSHPITLTNTPTIQAADASNVSHSIVLSGALSGAGALTKTGGGSLTLSGSNTYGGSTTVGTAAAGATNLVSGTANGGTLVAAANAALGSTSSIVVHNGSTLMLSNGAATDRINGAGIALGSAGGSGVGGTLALDHSFGGTTTSEGTGATVLSGTATGVSSVGLGVLSLASNSTLDFGTGGVGTLTLAGFIPAGSTLTILNWNNTAYNSMTFNSGVDGVNDRLIFNQLLSQAERDAINFGAGYTTTQVDLGGGFYEIGGELAAVPEPSTLALGVMFIVVAGWRGRRHLGRFGRG